VLKKKIAFLALFFGKKTRTTDTGFPAKEKKAI
jgi:hypothetical protein